MLREVSIEFARGQLTSLTGASGSGKSTLISLLAGLAVPDAGRVVFDGDDLAHSTTSVERGCAPSGSASCCRAGT